MRFQRKESARPLVKIFLGLALGILAVSGLLYFVSPSVWLVVNLVIDDPTELTIYSDVVSPSGRLGACVFYVNEGAMGSLNRMVSVYDKEQGFSPRTGISVLIVRGDPFIDLCWESEFSLLVTVVGSLREASQFEEGMNVFELDDDAYNQDLVVTTRRIQDPELVWTFRSQGDFAESGCRLGAYTRKSGTPSEYVTVVIASENEGGLVTIYDREILLLDGKRDLDFSNSAKHRIEISCDTCDDKSVLHKVDRVGEVQVEFGETGNSGEKR